MHRPGGGELMVDTPTSRNRLRKQELGTNTNTWGDDNLNEVIDAIDQALDGVESIALTGDKTLTTSNYSTADESLNRVLKLTGSLASAATLTVPSVEHWYLVINSAGAQVTVKTAAGSGVALADGATALVYCDGADVFNGAPTLIGGGATVDGALTVGGKISGVTAATAGSDAVNKTQMDATIAAQLTSGDGSVANSATDTTRRFLSSAIEFYGALSGATQDAAADEWLGVKLLAARHDVSATLNVGSINTIKTAGLTLTLPSDGAGIDGADLVDGDVVVVIDQSGGVDASAVTLNGGGNDIKLHDQTAAATLSLDTNYAMVVMTWDNTNSRWDAVVYGG